MAIHRHYERKSFENEKAMGRRGGGPGKKQSPKWESWWDFHAHAMRGKEVPESEWVARFELSYPQEVERLKANGQWPPIKT